MVVFVVVVEAINRIPLSIRLSAITLTHCMQYGKVGGFSNHR